MFIDILVTYLEKICFFSRSCSSMFLMASLGFLLVFIDISYGKFGSTDRYVMDVHLIEMAERTDTQVGIHTGS